MSEKFLYTGWFDDEFVQHAIGNGGNRDYPNNGRRGWTLSPLLVKRIRKKFPIREQQKNDCTVMSAISAYEVQNRKRWDKRYLKKLGAIKQTIEKGLTYKIQFQGYGDLSNPHNSGDQGRLYTVEQLSALVDGSCLLWH